MKRYLSAVVAASLMFASAGAALADDHGHDDGHHASGAMGGGHPNPAMSGGHMSTHSNWHKGGRMAMSDWNRGSRVDWRSHHLRQPPRGYEWRQVDGNYVLAAVATGLIASLILSSH